MTIPHCCVSVHLQVWQFKQSAAPKNSFPTVCCLARPIHFQLGNHSAIPWQSIIAADLQFWQSRQPLSARPNVWQSLSTVPDICQISDICQMHQASMWSTSLLLRRQFWQPISGKVWQWRQCDLSSYLSIDELATSVRIRQNLTIR